MRDNAAEEGVEISIRDQGIFAADKHLHCASNPLVTMASSNHFWTRIRSAVLLSAILFDAASAHPNVPQHAPSLSFVSNLQPRAACSGNTADTRSEWCDYSIETDYYNGAYHHQDKEMQAWPSPQLAYKIRAICKICGLLHDGIMASLK